MLPCQSDFLTSSRDVPALAAQLCRGAIVRLSKEVGHLTGVAVGAKRMRLSTKWRRRAREWDTLLGQVEKMTPASVEHYLWELDLEIERAKRESQLAGGVAVVDAVVVDAGVVVPGAIANAARPFADAGAEAEVSAEADASADAEARARQPSGDVAGYLATSGSDGRNFRSDTAVADGRAVGGPVGGVDGSATVCSVAVVDPGGSPSQPETVEDLIWNLHSVAVVYGATLPIARFKDAYLEHLGHECALDLIDPLKVCQGLASTLSRIPHVLTVGSTSDGITAVVATQHTGITRDQLIMADQVFRLHLQQRTPAAMAAAAATAAVAGAVLPDPVLPEDKGEDEVEGAQFSTTRVNPYFSETTGTNHFFSVGMNTNPYFAGFG